MRTHYPEDLTGESPDNIAEGSLSTLTYPNRFNLVVPFEAPFFRNGLEIKDTDGNLLFEGIDYYLALYYSAGAHAASAQLFGGIMLLTKTEITYKLQVLGSSYSVPESDIGKFLVNPAITEPRNTDWSALMRYQIPIEPVDPPKDLDEAIARDSIAAAINNIRLKIEEKAGQLDTDIDAAITALSRSAAKMYDDKLFQHHKTPHQHKYTPADVGALAVDAAATNAVKAFSKTLAQLVAIMVENKISQRVVDTLIDDTMGQVFGRFRAINNDELVYATADGKSALRFSAGKILLTGTEAVVELAADSDNNGRGIGVSSRAGYDELFVPSKGSAAGAKDVRPIYNGAFLITPSTVTVYLYPPLNSNAQPTFTSTPTVRIGGNGSATSPVNMAAQPPSATDTVEGLFRLTDNVEVIAPNYALSQKGVNDLLLKLNNYVDETFKINGAAFGATQTINLTKASFGLGNVNNTAPADKPVTQPFRDALTNKALKVHSHVASDLLNVPTASETVSGLTYLYTILDATTDKAATSKLGYDLKLKIDAAEDKALNLLPSWVANGTYYGDSGFLPIPTAGQYKGTSSLIDGDFNAMQIVQDGRLYILRNGWDGYVDSQRVFYWYRDCDPGTDNLSNTSYLSTAVQYKPAGMAKKYPGIELMRVCVTGDDAAIFVGTDALYYLVLFNGTADAAKHTDVVRVTYAPVPRASGQYDFVPLPGADYIHIVDKDVYVVRPLLNSNEMYTCLWVIPLSDFSKTDTVFASVPLAGKYPDGNVGRLATYAVNSTDPNTTSLYYVTPAGDAKWTGARNVVHSARRNWLHARQDKKIRLRANCSTHISNSVTAWGVKWQISYVLDLTAKTVTLDDDFLPMELNENGVTDKGGNYHTNNSDGSLYGNRINSNVVRKTYFDVIGNDNSNSDNYNVRISLGGKTPFEALRWDNPLTGRMGGEPAVLGAYGSVYQYRMRGMIQLGNSVKKALFRRTNTGDCIQTGYDTAGSYNFPGYGGWGPSNDRTSLPEATYNTLARCAYVFDGTNNYLNGTAFYQAETRAYKNINGNASVHADRVTVSTTQWADFQSMLVSRIPKFSEAASKWKVTWLNLFDLGGVNLCIATATFCQTEADGINYMYYYTFRVPMTFAAGVLTLNFSGTTTIATEDRVNAATTGFAVTGDYWQLRLIKRSDGWVIRTHALGYMPTVGGGTMYTPTITCDLNFANWTLSRDSANPAYGEYDIVHLPETNEILAAQWISNGAYYGGTAYSNNSRNFTTGPSRQVILFGPQLAEGMLLYITQAIPFFAKMEEHIVPVSQFDFKALFPSGYQNQTFYFHVQLNATTGAAEYLVSKTQLADTDSRLYIGYVVTTLNALGEVNITRVKRLGQVGALLAHADNPYAHGYLPGGSLTESIYSNMENLGTINTFSFPSFQDIYNSWYRFSHATTTETRPANESELLAWKYVAADDIVECTLNTATFVGFISDELVGDYVFNTVITSNDTDNDATAIVVAALKANENAASREQTLCLVISNSIEGHLGAESITVLKENYLQSNARTVGVVDTSVVDQLAWNTWYAHAYVERRGNKLYIAVQRAKLPTTGDRDTNIRTINAAKRALSLGQLRNDPTYKYLEVDLAVAAPTFARSCRFGYGAASQNATRFWNLGRPGADLSKAYGTAAALDNANALAGAFDAVQRITLPQVSNGNWFQPTNKVEKLWPQVLQSTNSYTPPLAAPAIKVNAPPLAAGVVWGTKTYFTPTSLNLVLNVQVDDSVDIYINGVSRGSGGTQSFTIGSGGLLLNQVNALCLVVKEAPGNTPCYIAFELIQDGATKLVSSSLDMTAVILPTPAIPASVPGPSSIGLYTLTVPTGKDYILALRPDSTTKAPVFYWTEERTFAGGRYIDIYYDAQWAALLDVMIHDSSLSM
ncbi:putative virion structural protein [Erwinia phage vB_EamM_Phobos]|uniref:putative virion structural protein n=1 Tax=Erwinia phage vB_EamM_Phobos TaxID=1883377 RepID=UPI00081CC255|nr:putative virion structural protein [Erwinia phage vB_EamM_Phobos]ANZ50360.1 putative virion structural protein [Erwinia phage vB_EamM_Phobos]